MYVGILLILFFIYMFGLLFCNLAKNNHTWSKVRMQFLGGVVFYLFSCTLFSYFLLGDYFGGYFSTISDDSLRYINESKMFMNSLWDVDELNGIYFNYDVTPKMGISSLMAWSNSILGLGDNKSLYVLNNLVALIFFLIAAKFTTDIIIRFKCRGKIILAIFLVIFVFPLDFYWLFKLLRESVANILFLILLLLQLLMMIKPRKRYSLFFSYFTFWLLLYRPQLAMISCGFFLLYNFLSVRNKGYFAIAFIMMCFSVFQSIATTGLLRLNGVLNNIGITFLGDAFEYIFSLNIEVLLLCVIAMTLLTVVIQKDRIESDIKTIFRAYKASCLIFVVFGLAIYLTQSFMQIRFIYPFLYFVKMFFFLVLLENNQSKLEFRRENV